MQKSLVLTVAHFFQIILGIQKQAWLTSFSNKTFYIKILYNFIFYFISRYM